MRLLLLVSLLLLTPLHLNAASKVVASVDKNPAMLDEAIILSVIVDADVDSNQLDLQMLEQDFIVGRTSTSSQTRMVNFNTTRTTQWQTRLIPRNTGRFTIPAFTIDGVSSQPIELMVVPPGKGGSGERRDFFITANVDQKQVYLQQQLAYTIKLHLAADLQRGSLAAPELTNANIQQIGNDKEYSQLIDGNRYQVIERNFAIVPQQSGRFVIQGPLFEGEVLGKSRQNFGFFNRTQRISRVAPRVEIEVLPIPAGYQGHWLPSEMVQLHEEWQGGNDFRVGEPITRILTLTALGTVQEQLPEINSQYPAGIKVYPDQATSSTIEKEQSLIAQRIERMALIPNQPGKLTLPPVKVQWFNSQTQQSQWAELPAKTIEVLPALASNNAPPATPAPTRQAEPAVAQPTAPPATTPGSPHWWSLSSWLLLALWLGTLLICWLGTRKRKAAAASTQTTLPTDNAGNLQKDLFSALQQGDHSTAYPALLAYVNQLAGSQQQSLSQCLAQLKNPLLNQEIDAYLASRYHKQQASWQADNLIKLLQQQGKTPNTNQKTGLAPLYPIPH